MTVRADPTASIESARKHFFRHFHDMKELRRNPLAARFFEAAEAEGRPAPEHAALLSIHRAILHIVEDFEATVGKRHLADPLRRQLRLFRSYVFDQRAPEDLAREFGLSLRQFYRDYHVIRDRILDGLRLPARVTATEWLNADELPIQQAHLLVQAGLTPSAMRVLRNTAKEEIARPEMRAKALCELARLEIDNGRYSDAQCTLHQISLLSASREVLAARTFLAELLRWSSCGAFSADAPAGATLNVLVQAALDQRRCVETYVDWLLFKANQADWAGDSDAVLTALKAARVLLDTLPKNAIPQRVMHARGFANALMEKSYSDFPRAVAILNDAIDSAWTNGFTRSAIFASSTLAQTYRSAGEHEKAKALSEEVLRLAKQTQDSELMTWMCIELPHSDPREAIELYRQVEKLFPAPDHRYGVLHYMMSTAYSDLGDKINALKYADLAHKHAIRLGYLRSIAVSLRQLAKAQLEVGDLKAASQTIEEATVAVEQLGRAHSIAFTRAVRQRIAAATRR